MALDDRSEHSDATLLLAYANGDLSAARILTQRLTPRVLAHAYRLTGQREDAEDIAQEAMLRLWRIAPDWRHGEAQITTWLYRVVANLCTDRLRQKRTVPLDDVDAPVDDTPGAEARLQRQARADALQAALSTLPPRQRQAVVLRHIEGMTNPEIAAIMEIGVEAVESLTARGKRTLVKLLDAQKHALGVTL